MADLRRTKQSKQGRLSDYALFRISFLVAALLGFLIIVPAVLFVVNITINAFTFILAAVLSLLVYFGVFTFSLVSLRDAGIAAALIVIALALSGSIMDVTFDGVSYQKTAVGALAHGWNPYHGSIEGWAAQQPERQDLYQFSVWIDHYPKATWFIGASIYALTGNIECGKAFTFLMMLVVFGLISSFLLQRGLKKWQSFTVATLAAINPITMAQCISYYNDALLMLCLFAIIACLTSLLFAQEKAVYILMFFALVICSNIKFTGLVYALAFCCMYLVALFLWRRKQKKSLLPYLKPIVMIFMGTMILALLAGPYITNMEEHQSPFYPLFGADAVDIIGPNQPASFETMSSAEKVFYSTFSYSEDLTAESGMADPQLKIPFTVSAEELAWLGVADLRIGGFGVFYGPLLVFSIIVIIAALILTFRRNRLVFLILLGNTILMTAMMLAISESWWARYSGYLYGATVAALALLFWCINQKSKKQPSRVFLLVFTIAFTALIAVNTALFFPSERLEDSAESYQEIEALRQLSEQEDLTLCFNVGGNQYTGLFDSLVDAGVVFDTVPESEEGMELTLNYRVFYGTT